MAASMTASARNIVSRVRIEITRHLAMEINPSLKAILNQVVRLRAHERSPRRKVLRATRFLFRLFEHYIRSSERYFLLSCLVYLHSELNWFPDLAHALRMKLVESSSAGQPPTLEPLTYPDGHLPNNRIRALLK